MYYQFSSICSDNIILVGSTDSQHTNGKAKNFNVIEVYHQQQVWDIHVASHCG